jgi:hypothetical protein
MLVNPLMEAAVPAAAIALASGIWWTRRPKGAKRVEPQPARAVEPVPQTSAPLPPAPEVATRIIVGVSPDQPAFELALTTDDAAFEQAAPLSTNGRLGLMSRMSACLQAAPSLLVQQAHQGRHLMEVVINNPLANSANGSHYLPYATGANGRIIEQAKLLKPENLSSLVNTAAVWQVASVVVAQKHLADISAKLDEIKQGIDDLKGLYQDTLDGDIEGTYRYLRTVAKSFELGEVPQFARVELETCRRELLQTESALLRMFKRRLNQTIEHKETVGTEDLLKDTLARYNELDKITTSLMTCFKTEALAWHVLSLFPGEEAMAQVWKEETIESMAAFAQMQTKIKETALVDVGRFKSWFNLESTLEERRAQVTRQAAQTAFAIDHSASQFQSGMDMTALRLEHNNDSIRLGVEIIDGQIQQVRVMA